MTREQIEAMLDGLDGVTPGPWSVEANHAIVHDSRFQTCCGRGTVHGCCGEPEIGGDCFQIEFHNPVNAAHIARCDPDTIRALCTLALEALDDKERRPYVRLDPSEYERLRAENERLRAALKPFAEDFDDEDDGVPDIYRNARAALEREPE